MMVVLGADIFEPDRFALATVIPRHRPRSGQGAVDGRHVIMQHVRISLVEIDALFDADILAPIVISATD